ncbi:MAG: TolC family protein [Thermotogota bacterium]
MKLKYITLSVFLIISIFSFSSVNSIIEEKLNENSNYQKSLENYISTKYSNSIYNNWFQPYLSLSTNQLTGITITEDGLSDIGLNAEVNIANFYGVNFGVQIPFDIKTEDSFDFDVQKENISLSITYGLKTEYFSNRLSRESNLLSSQHNLEEIEDSIIINTFKEVFNYYYLKNNIDLQYQKLELLEDKHENSELEDERDNLKKQMLNQESLILSLENSLANINIDFSEELYIDSKSKIKNIVNNSFDLSIDNRKDIEALELAKEVDKRNTNLWFLPFLPDLNFTFGVRDYENWNWEFGINFQYDILDRGERLGEALTRKNNITTLEYNEKIETINRNIKNHENSLDTMNLELQILELDYENLIDDLEKSDNLNKLGYISNIDHNLNLINLEVKKLEIEKQKNEIIIKELELLNEKGLYIRGELN